MADHLTVWLALSPVERAVVAEDRPVARTREDLQKIAREPGRHCRAVDQNPHLGI